MLFAFTEDEKKSNITFVRDYYGEFEQTRLRLQLKLEKLFKLKDDKETNKTFIIQPQGILINNEVKVL